MEVKMDLNTQVDKQIIQKAHEAVELASKSGKIKKGTNEVTKTIERGTAKLVLVAQDTNPKEIIMHIPALCEEKNIPFIPVPKRQELGEVAGLNIPTSAISITQEGEAKQTIKELLLKLKE
ncbi:50S ribosomal protein L7Ae [Candidatus Woesearchaeota archaeon]|nr:50S ribosomal protein L7Ae [Candidatus Woesearchaeota archaeon]